MQSSRAPLSCKSIHGRTQRVPLELITAVTSNTGESNVYLTSSVLSRLRQRTLKCPTNNATASTGFIVHETKALFEVSSEGVHWVLEVLLELQP